MIMRMKRIISATKAWINDKLSYPGIKALRRAIAAEAKARGVANEVVLDEALRA